MSLRVEEEGRASVLNPSKRTVLPLVVILPRDRRCCCVDKVSKSTFDSPHTPLYSLTCHCCQYKADILNMDAEHFSAPAPDFPKKRCG